MKSTFPPRFRGKADASNCRSAVGVGGFGLRVWIGYPQRRSSDLSTGAHMGKAETKRGLSVGCCAREARLCTGRVGH